MTILPLSEDVDKRNGKCPLFDVFLPYSWLIPGNVYEALTGSHRIEIARRAGVDIEAVVLNESAIDELNSFLSDNYGYDFSDFLYMDENQQSYMLGEAVREGHRSDPDSRKAFLSGAITA